MIWRNALLVSEVSEYGRNFFALKCKRPLERVAFCGIWLREQDLNLRPSGYEPDNEIIHCVALLVKFIVEVSICKGYKQFVGEPRLSICATKDDLRHINLSQK